MNIVLLDKNYTISHSFSDIKIVARIELNCTSDAEFDNAINHIKLLESESYMPTSKYAIGNKKPFIPVSGVQTQLPQPEPPIALQETNVEEDSNCLGAIATLEIE